MHIFEFWAIAKKPTRNYQQKAKTHHSASTFYGVPKIGAETTFMTSPHRDWILGIEYNIMPWVPLQADGVIQKVREIMWIQSQQYGSPKWGHRLPSIHLGYLLLWESGF